MMDVGQRSTGLEQQMRINKEAVPVKMQAPSLNAEEAFYLEAFLDLDTERDSTQGFSPIPWSSIQDYADRHGSSDDERQNLVHLIKCLDLEHSKRVTAAIERARKEAERKARSR